MVAFANFRRVYFFLFTEVRASTVTFFVSSHNPFSTQTFWCRLVKKFHIFILGITVKKYLQNNGNTDAIIFLH